MIADQNFFDMFYILSYGFGYGKDRSFSGPNIRLRPKVKITPTVQHWPPMFVPESRVPKFNGSGPEDIGGGST